MSSQSDVRVLKVDLSSGEIRRDGLSQEIAKRFIGGRGVGTYYIDSLLSGDVDAFSPENPLVFATGPLTGSSAPTGGRYMVLCKSPLTGLIACSNSGGHFGAELKRAGIDLLCFIGKAKSPTYLLIHNDQVELRDAGHLWGKDTHESTDMILDEVGIAGAKVACIGPAGENLVRFA
ncbi:MAG TPA: aldehyde ferredoxin oxidoreductase, partial [Dissulfuribacter thermophilus]|nr:aldehyde ferredoxin oxidoreductase [Dissulfuribacter thermophilus]